MKNIILFGLSVIGICSIQAQNWQNLNATTPISASYLIAASHLGDNIMVIGNNQLMALSIDKGASWTAPTITRPPGQFVALYNGGDRIYANMKINTYDYELHYTLDNGTTWTRDTIGLPQNYVDTGKLSMNVKNMGNGYLMAYDATHTSYKQNGTTAWIQTTISTSISDVTSLNDVWYVLGQNDIMKSTDHGATWAPAPLNGLPRGGGWFKITTNGVNRMFILESPANGGNEVYYSDDSGESWRLTNSAGHYTHQNAWLGAMYAVEDYVFAAVNPASGGFFDPPPYLFSSTKVPDFQKGDTNGLFTRLTTSPLPLFFHIDDKLYTMNWDLFSSNPGFKGTLGIDENIEFTFNAYPNPTKGAFYLDIPVNTKWILTSIDGKVISKGVVKDHKTNINMETLDNGIYLVQTFFNGKKVVKKVVKY